MPHHKAIGQPRPRLPHSGRKQAGKISSYCQPGLLNLPAPTKKRHFPQLERLGISKRLYVKRKRHSTRSFPYFSSIVLVRRAISQPHRFPIRQRQLGAKARHMLLPGAVAVDFKAVKWRGVKPAQRCQGALVACLLGYALDARREIFTLPVGVSKKFDRFLHFRFQYVFRQHQLLVSFHFWHSRENHVFDRMRSNVPPFACQLAKFRPSKHSWFWSRTAVL